MATQDKLLKTLEHQKLLITAKPTRFGSSDLSARRREKIQNCHIIVDSLCNLAVVIAPKFTQLLSMSMDVLLFMCNDDAPDIRMVAEECLNKLIKSMIPNVNRILIELHIEIKRNGEQTGSLRTALYCFAQLVQYIRIQKGRAFVSKLITPLVHVIERDEESVHETLSVTMPKIFTVLGCFTSDNDIKALLKAYFGKIAHNSSAIRRTSTRGILTLCTLCRKPYIFITYCLHHLLDLLVPIQESIDSAYILGPMMAIKLLLPKYEQSRQQETSSTSVFRHSVQHVAKPFDTEQYLQLYELCLHHLSHTDHNVLNASLEILYVILSDSPDKLKSILKSPQGINKTRLNSVDVSFKSVTRSPSQISIATTMRSDENLLSESDIPELIHTNIEKWIDDSKLTVIPVNYIEGQVEDNHRNSDTYRSVSSSFDIIDNVSAEYSNISMGEISEQFEDIAVSTPKSKSHYIINNGSIHRDTSSDESLSIKNNECHQSAFNFRKRNVIIGSFIGKAVSLHYCARLLVNNFLLCVHSGKLVPDHEVRVSVKNLSLTCLAGIIRLEPEVLVLPLDLLDESTKLNLSEVLQYAGHSDPQLRGATQVLIGAYLEAVFKTNPMNYDTWIGPFCQTDLSKCVLTLEELINIVKLGLRDESSYCVRQTLTILCSTLRILHDTSDARFCAAILEKLPLLSRSPHWLVKVKLLELVATLDYTTVANVTDSLHFQNDVIHNIQLELSLDPDPRVRNAAAQSIVSATSILYFPEDFPSNTHIVNKAIQLQQSYYSSHCDFRRAAITVSQRTFVDTMPFPFNRIYDLADPRTGSTLARLVRKFHYRLLTDTSKFVTYGCIETLTALILSYPSTQFGEAWSCYKSQSVKHNKTIFQRSISTLDRSISVVSQSIYSANDLLTYCVNLLHISNHIYDFRFHLSLLQLAGNLFSGKALFNLKVSEPITTESSPELWGMFDDRALVPVAEQLLAHVVRLLSVFSHVLNGTTPIVASSKPTLPQLASSSASALSPIKRRKSEVADLRRFVSPEKDDRGADISATNVKINAMGYFASSAHYMKVYEGLQLAYNNYKVTLNEEATENFTSFLRVILVTLSQVLEIATLVEIGRIVEEVLQYLRATFNLDPTLTIVCVRQLLKSLAGTNLAKDHTEFNIKDQSHMMNGKGFYEIAVENQKVLVTFLERLSNSSRSEEHSDTTLMGYLHRNEVVKAGKKSNDKILSNYILVFETLVIEALRMYTITTDVALQCQVLELLNQLIQLQVNYCLLDKEQIFISFVLKQFDFIERGEIVNSKDIIPKIFQLLVRLSYSKQHTKSIIDVPKIMQLCDLLLASGQPTLTHCLPALRPVVEDVFTLRNKSNTSDFKELETTREVLLSTLLRLFEFGETADLLVVVLNEARYSDSVDKWQRWSHCVCSALLPMMDSCKVRFENRGTYESLQRLLLELCPFSYDGWDGIYLSLFNDPPHKDASMTIFTRWLGKLALLLTLLLQQKEEAILKKIVELQADFCPQIIFSNVSRTVDPLNVSNVSDLFDGIAPEMVFGMFACRTLNIITDFCHNELQVSTDPSLLYAVTQYLTLIIHILSSGNFDKVSNTFRLLCLSNKSNVIDLAEVSEQVLRMKSTQPIIVITYSKLFSLLDHSRLENYWNAVLKSTTNMSLNQEVSRYGSLLFCIDAISEKQSKWAITHLSNQLVSVQNEPTIAKFLAEVHRNPALSELLLKSLNFKQSDLDKVLKVLEQTHLSLSATLIPILIPNMLVTNNLHVSRSVASLTSRRVEYLLTLSQTEVTSQLKEELLASIILQLHDHKLSKRHAVLYSLLNKLAAKFYNIPTNNVQESIQVDEIKQLRIDEKWYLEQVRLHTTTEQDDKDLMFTVELLNKLSPDDLCSILGSNNFNVTILQNCFQYIRTAPADISTTHLLQACSSFFMSEIQRIINCPIIYQDQYLPIVAVVTEFLIARAGLLITDANFGVNLLEFCIIQFDSVNLIQHSEVSAGLHAFTSILAMGDHVMQALPMRLLYRHEHARTLCDIVLSLHQMLDALLHAQNDEPLPIMTFPTSFTASSDEMCQLAWSAAKKLAIIVFWFQRNHRSGSQPLSKSVLRHVANIVKRLTQVPIFNSFVMSPESLWQHQSGLKLSGRYQTEVPSLPINVLHELDDLEDFIFRMNFIGWSTKKQFEESWVCLLGVLSAVPEDGSPAEEIDAVVQTTCRAVRAITTLLIQTLRHPIPGNNVDSTYLHIPRNLPNVSNNLNIQKLKRLQSHVMVQLHSLFPNYVEQFSNVFTARNPENISRKYGYCQLSVHYLWLSAKVVDVDNEDSHTKRLFVEHEGTLRDIGLDVNSCLQFLIDLYTQWFNNAPTSLKLLHESVKSVLQISDLFNEKRQYSWMLEMFTNLLKSHSHEDEIIMQYLVIGICKATSVLTPDVEVYELIKRSITQNLKNAFLPVRVAALYGLLYVVESLKLSNTVIAGISEELQMFLPVMTEYILANITTTNGVILQAQEHTLILWSLSFFLIENVDVSFLGNEFVDVVSYAAIALLSDAKINMVIFNALIKGMESLIITQRLHKKTCDNIMKLALELVKHNNPIIALPALQLLLSCMYIEFSEQLYLRSVTGTHDKIQQSNPDNFVPIVEKVSTIFERIRRGNSLEVQVICAVLPTVINDFFMPADIMTKVIGEFLSPQQHHPKLMSKVVFEIFERAITESQLSLIQDWIVCSLCNFTQSLPMGMATWCLTCFFISASTHAQLRYLFPYAQSRIGGRCEFPDRWLLCVAGRDFYTRLATDEQRARFTDTFRNVANLAETPFQDLLACL